MLDKPSYCGGKSSDCSPLMQSLQATPPSLLSGMLTPPVLPSLGSLGGSCLPPALEAYTNAQSESSPASTSKAATYDDGKSPLAWLPWSAVEAMCRVQQYGHRKYGDFNNYKKGMEVSRNLSCALRHLKSYLQGQDLDPESGENHLAHAMCRLAFVLENIADGTAVDDRYKP